MSIERHEVGQRLSQTAIYAGLVHLAGQVAVESAGGSVAEQTEEILGMIDRRLAAAGSGKDAILSATVFLADMGQFDAFNAVWDAWVVPGHTPPRACLEAKMTREKYKVEIIIVAAPR
jgi:enamine deaminase RidA (YjgF/YER057c/UK114 family)